MVKDLSAAGHAISSVGNHGVDTKFFRHVDGIRLQAPRRDSHKISLFLQPADRFPCTVRIIGSKRCCQCSVYIKKKYRSYSLPCSLFMVRERSISCKLLLRFSRRSPASGSPKMIFYICIIIRKIIIISHTILRRYYAVYFTFDRAQHTGHHSLVLALLWAIGDERFVPSLSNPHLLTSAGILLLTNTGLFIIFKKNF